MEPEPRRADPGAPHLGGRIGASGYPPVPESLHSIYEGGAFARCLVCEVSLDRAMYQIHKAHRGSECVLEAAICVACLEEMSASYSTESKRVLRGFQRRLLDTVDEASCGSCGRVRDHLDGYSRVGLCHGPYLVRPVVLLCSACEERIHASLSPETRDAYDAFVRDHFPGVPAGLEWEPLKV